MDSLKERECPTCGKIFVPAPEHVFVEGDKVFCKWTCLCDYRKKKKLNDKERRNSCKHKRRYTREQRDEILRMLFDEGKTIRYLSTKYDIAYTTILHWKEERKSENAQVV